MATVTSADMLPFGVIRLLVPRLILHETSAFLNACGKERHEGMVLWAGRPTGSGKALLTRVIIPEQIAETSGLGCSVRLTPEAHYTLPDHLERGERFYVRVHSHPHEAYHSSTDDANEVLTHQGAISVVVPNFARDPIALPDCAIYYLDFNCGWLPLACSHREAAFTLFEDPS